MKKVALITGASRGIGLASARKFASEGYDVICSYSKTPIEEFKSIRANLVSETDIINLFSSIPKLDVLVNCAGIHGQKSKLEDLSFNQIDEVFKNNTYSVFLCCREAVKLMKESGGTIVNISSEAAKFGGVNMSAYAASKAAINTLTVALAREVAEYKIRVNAVSPGIIDTGIHDTAKASTIPLGRMGTTQEVADTIFYLASDSASYVSGAILSVAGAR